ncbi:NAD-dependent DNA ligase LigA [Helicobacter suis]|uniref:NAD-dependent DNA ligase LigA n=1 Tax=Helicobacter suis TaxID=104628 RepID=UPI000CF19A32|nr:NAD-dependent DNA ligase LigA [Helicobacter suis]BCD47470.1 hypothetical protein NHP194003_06740 [Helicobacter suis]
MIQTFEDYKHLVDKLCQYAYHYYVLASPLISDAIYDQLYRQVLDYETKYPQNILPYSPTQRVGGVVLETLPKHTHKVRMWSLENVFNLEELQVWINRIVESEHALKTKGRISQTYPSASFTRFTCSPKLDGASLNLYYENGQLQSASMRGNGLEGELVTHNAKTIHSIPLIIPYTKPIEIRGEVVLQREDFKALNAERLKQNLPLFANARNATVGSLRQLDSKIAAQRKLTFYPWGLGLVEEKYTSLKQSMQMVKDWGFLSLEFVLCESLEAIEETFKLFHTRRSEVTFDADGMVVMLDDLYLQSILGFTIKSPRFGFAYKFPATEKHTKLLDVLNQVGRSGAITPVALLEPIKLEGACISKATLDNYTQIQQQGLMINDTVVIVRSGDVIPKIIKPLKHLRNGTQKPITPPTHCPACQSVLQKQPLNVCPECNLPLLLKNKPNFCPKCQILFKKYTHCPVCQTLLGKQHKKCPQCQSNVTFPKHCLQCGGDLELKEYCYRCDLDLSNKDRYLFCPNKDCMARVKESIVYFASKHGLEIKGLGDKVVAQLLQAGLIKGVIDLYSLEEKALLELEGWQQKKAQNLLQAITKSKQAPLWRFISALGIEHIGKGASKILARHFGLEVFDKTYQEIASLEGFGAKGLKEEEKKIAASFVRFVKENKGLIKQLLTLVNPIATEKKVTPSFFKDKKIVITGSLEKPRTEISALLESLGAHVQTGVSSKTDLLIYGENPGSKLEKAKKLGIEVMEEVTFLERLKSEGNG